MVKCFYFDPASTVRWGWLAAHGTNLNFEYTQARRSPPLGVSKPTNYKYRLIISASCCLPSGSAAVLNRHTSSAHSDVLTLSGGSS